MVIPPGFANTVYLFAINGDAELMQTAVGIDLGAAAGDFEAVLTLMQAAWVDNVLPLQSTECSLAAIDLVVGQDGTDPITISRTVNDAGGDGTFPLPPNTALLVRKNTAAGGRANRGRLFVPGWALTGDVSSAGIVGPTQVAAAQSAFDDFLVEVRAGPPADVDVVLFHSEGAIEPTPITTLSVQNKVATQRRRLRP